MANPVSIVTSSVSIVQAIINLSLKIKNQVDTFQHNREDCRKIGELVATVRAVAEGLQKSTEKEDGGTLVGGALSALKQALERAWDLVAACQRKNKVLRALDADAIAVKLRRVYLDVSLNLSAVVLANGAYNTTKLADIYVIVAALRAEVAYNTRMLAKISAIVDALPEHLRQEVARLVESYTDSTDDDVTYIQNKSTTETKKAETKKTKTKKTDDDTTDEDATTYYQNKSTTGETKKTDDVARHPTFLTYPDPVRTHGGEFYGGGGDEGYSVVYRVGDYEGYSVRYGVGGYSGGGGYGGGGGAFAGAHMGGGAPRPQYGAHGIPHSFLVPEGTWERANWSNSAGEGWQVPVPVGWVQIQSNRKYDTHAKSPSCDHRESATRGSDLRFRTRAA